MPSKGCLNISQGQGRLSYFLIVFTASGGPWQWISEAVSILFPCVRRSLSADLIILRSRLGTLKLTEGSMVIVWDHYCYGTFLAPFSIQVAFNWVDDVHHVTYITSKNNFGETIYLENPILISNVVNSFACPAGLCTRWFGDFLSTPDSYSLYFIL